MADAGAAQAMAMTLEQQRAEAEAEAARKAAGQPQHFELGQAPGDGPLPAGYDPKTGTVSHDAGAGVAGLTSAVEGMPIAGPYAQKGVEWLSSQIASALSGQPADQVQGEMSQMVDQAQAAHPVASTVGGVGGAILGTAPAILAAPEAFGAGGGSLLARSLISAMTGAGIGGADSGVRGGVEAIPSGAAWGGALGLLGPGAGQAVGAGTRAIASRFGGGSAAEQAFSRAAGSDAVGPTQIAAMHPDMMPLDLGPNLQRQAGALAATPGRGQEIVRSAISARDAGANARIKSGIDTNLGPAAPPSQITGSPTNPVGLTGLQRRLGPEYERVLGNAKAVDTTAIANDLQSAIANERGPARTALESVLGDLRIKGTDVLDPHPRAALATRHAIDGMIDNTQDTNVKRVLGAFRRRLDTELTKAVPNIKVVDQKYARLAKQKEAITRGGDVLKGGDNAIWPQELAGEIAKGGPVIQGRLAQGTRAAIENIVGTNANDRVSLQRIIKGEGSWNREKLAQLFGQDKADNIIALLDRESTIAGSSKVVTQNSETAARQAAQKDVTLPEKKPGVLRSAANLQFGEAAARAGDRIASAFRGAGQEATNTELAKLLTSNDPQAATRVINIVQAAQRRGDISAQKAKEIMQSLRVSGAQQGQERQPLRLTVGKRR